MISYYKAKVRAVRLYERKSVIKKGVFYEAQYQGFDSDKWYDVSYMSFDRWDVLEYIQKRFEVVGEQVGEEQ